MISMEPAPSAPQRLVTAKNYSADKYRLLELNPDVEKALVVGDKVSIVGSAHQRAVLCIPDKSYYLVKEDMSNLRLLTRHTEWTGGSDQDEPPTHEIVVDGAAGYHYVLEPRVPDMMQLKKLLLEAPYTKSMGASLNRSEPKRAKLHKLYTTINLMAELQSSEYEILGMLRTLHAFENAGSWRILDPTYQASVFGDILNAIIQNDWDFQKQGVAVSQLIRAIDEPEIVVRQCCQVYGTLKSCEDGEDRCVFDSHGIAVFCAKQLFQEPKDLGVGITDGSDGWSLQTFMDKWQFRVPESVKVSEDLLQGIAIVKAQRGKPSRLQYFCEDDLPTDPKLRFNKLFEVQEKWTMAQLEPYISPLVRPGLTQASLLLKYARSSRQGNSNERLYSRR